MDSGRYEVAIGVDRILDDDFEDDEEVLCRLKLKQQQQQKERGEYGGLLYHVTTSKGCTAMVMKHV